MKVGDLVRSRWMGWVGIILAHDTATDTGQSWWRVLNSKQNKTTIVGEWDLVKLS